MDIDIGNIGGYINNLHKFILLKASELINKL